jgi:hypothetical protein
MKDDGTPEPGIDFFEVRFPGRVFASARCHCGRPGWFYVAAENADAPTALRDGRWLQAPVGSALQPCTHTTRAPGIDLSRLEQAIARGRPVAMRAIPVRSA